MHLRVNFLLFTSWFVFYSNRKLKNGHCIGCSQFHKGATERCLQLYIPLETPEQRQAKWLKAMEDAEAFNTE